MTEAAKLLQGGASVKETGLSLGYRNPGDFTRAFKKKFGSTPTRLGSTNAKYRAESPSRRGG